MRYRNRQAVQAIMWVVLVLLMAPIAARAAEAPVGQCAALASVQIPDGRITSAERVAAPFEVPASMGPGPVEAVARKLGVVMSEQMAYGTVAVPFCRIVGVLTPTSSSDIHFEVWLPEEHYNGRLVEEGDGGLLGAIPYTLMSKLINRGFAVTGSDKGHDNSGNPMEWRWAVGQPEKVIDFHFRATHDTLIAAKTLMARFYGASARHSYFSGCSGGAVQGYEEAMHYPKDFDGMAIGGAAPPVVDPPLPPLGELPAILAQSKGLEQAKLSMVSRAAIAACDANDGVKDGVISYPKQCKFDPATLACSRSKGGQCLTDLEVAAIRKGYALGMSPGTEYYWRFLQNLGAIFPAEAYKYLFYPPPADQTYLQGFAAAGHKMIAYVGTVDVSAPGFEKYQEALVGRYQHSGLSAANAQERVRTFYRAFELAGMEHCTAGSGANNISASLQPERPALGPQQDIISALVAWVEHDRAPDFIVATKYIDDDPNNPVVMTRPICTYPRLAQWNRRGDPSDYHNFTCVDPPAH